LASDIGFWIRARLELAYFSGYALIMQRHIGGVGVVLRFQRVRPRRNDLFQPLQSAEITPRFLDQIIVALKRWKFDIISSDEVCRRAVRLASPRRFVCLTFDGASKDLITSAYPVLSRHRVPFTVYVPTAFPDGVGEAWWLALEALVARENRVSLIVDRKELHFNIRNASEKYQLHRFLESWMRSLPAPDLSMAINDLCKRYSIDLAALSRASSLDWSDLATLAADPLVTIGSATVNYPVLSNLKDNVAQREVTMGAAVARAAFHRPVRHFAYPFGDAAAFCRQHAGMVEEAGFVSAASAIPGVIEAAGRTSLYALPRISWDGRLRSLRALRVMLSGTMLPRPLMPPSTGTGNLGPEARPDTGLLS
jgi:peptidoglycan/xylan/chitin deacetylase (PgdA/CDA1 family)